MSSTQTPTSPQPELLLPQETGYRALLKNRNFLALWLGQIFSQIGDRIVFVVFIALIVKVFGPSDRYNSYLYIAFTIPAILLTAMAGVFVDRWPRRLVLVSTNLLRALCVALLPMAAAGAPWMIFGLAFLISAATQFFVPAEAATIPTIVPKHHLLVANSLFTTTMMASVIFGFALGDPLINIFSLSHVHWAITTLFGLAAVCLLLVNVPKGLCATPSGDVMICPPTLTLRQACTKFIDEIREGVDYIKTHPLVRNAMLKLAVLFSTVVAVCILFISFAKAYLFADAAQAARKFAYIITFSGIGMALGAFWVGSRFRNAKRGYLVFGGFMLMGLCLSLLVGIESISQADHVFLIPRLVTEFIYLDEVHLTYRMVYTYLLATLMGVGAAWVAIPLQALLHELIPEDKRGKVLGIQFTLLSTSSTLPVLAAGLAVEYIGVKAMLLLIGIPLLLLGLFGLRHRITDRHVTAPNW